jgi:tetrahydromethanopterin S-methyltransferase subunit G
MKQDFHVDMSGRIYEKKDIGIALVGVNTGLNYGCVLKIQLLKKIKKELFKENFYYDSAKLYAICIHFLVDDVRDLVDKLIICNDEDFRVVKKILDQLLGKHNFEIINITEFRKRLGRKVGSLADNYARIYRKKALRPSKYQIGKKINVINLSFLSIKQKWEQLSKNKL